MSNNIQTKNDITPVHFRIQGNQPTGEEAARLCAVPFPRTPPSKQDIRFALCIFIFGIIVALACLIVGILFIRTSEYGSRRLFSGYAAAYFGTPAMILISLLGIPKLLRSSRKKKAEGAMRWLWLTSLMGEDRVGTRFGDIEYALSALRRLMPPSLPFEESKVRDYIEQLRKTLADAADETTQPAKKTPPGGWEEAAPRITLRLLEEKELHPGVKELHASLIFQDRLSRRENKKTIIMVSALLELDIKQSFICSGGYWFPYEICSPIQRVSE